MKAFVPMGVVVMLLALPAAAASGINGINNAMPNRISMNVTVPKQTQGATFGEKVNAGLHAAAGAVSQGAARIDVACIGDACMIGFPDGDGVRADLAALQLSPLGEADRRLLAQPGEPHANASGRAIGQGASLVGGALPGAGIVSAAVSSVGALSSAGGGAASAGYAATGRVAALPSRSAEPGSLEVTQPLADGEYQLAVLVERAASGLKDTLKTNVRMAAPSRQVRIVLGFEVLDGALKVRHDTVKNSISNVR